MKVKGPKKYKVQMNCNILLEYFRLFALSSTCRVTRDASDVMLN